MNLLYFIFLLPLFYLIWRICLDYKTRLYCKHGTKKFVTGPPCLSPFGNFFEAFTDPLSFGQSMIQIYGKIYKLWLYHSPVYVLGDAVDVQQFYKHQKTNIKDPNLGFGYMLNTILGKCVGTMYGENWSRLRNMFDPYFAHRVLELNWQLISTAVQQHFDSFGNRFQTDCHEVMFALPLLVVAEMIYGPLEKVEKQQLSQLNFLHEDIVQSIFLNKWTRYGIGKWLPLQCNIKLRQFQKEWKKFNQEMVSKYANSKVVENKYAFYQLYSKMQDKEMTEDEFYHTLDEIMLTNVDVTSAGLAWSLLYIITNERVFDKLKKEIDSKRLQTDDDDTLMREYLFDSSTYLSCCVKEVARIQPLVSFTFPEVTTVDIRCKDFIIPKNSRVVVDYYAIHEDFEKWGRNCKEFIPERFEDANLDTKIRYSYNRYGLGYKKCIGRYVSDLLIKSMLIHLISTYEISIANGENFHIMTNKKLKQEKPFVTPQVQLSFARKN